MELTYKGIDDALVNGAQVCVAPYVSTSDEWGEIKEPVYGRLSAPTLPPRMVPEALRGWLVDAAERMGLPLEFIAAPAIGALATVVGRKIGIRPKQHDTWLVVPVIWSLLIARPGKKKSAAVKVGMAPISLLEACAEDAFKASQPMTKAKKAVFKAKRDNCQDALKAALKGRDDGEVAAVQRNLEALEGEEARSASFKRRYRTNDSTIERLAELLVQNPNGLVLERDELVGFLRSFEKQGHEADRAFFLECWNGDGRFQVDRISREATVDGLYLNIVAGTQPGKFDEYIMSASKGGGDDGLVQRFQMAVYPDFITRDPEVDRTPDAAARERAFEVFKRLDQLSPSCLGAAEAEGSSIPALRFSERGQIVFNEWLTDLLRRLDSESLEPTVESHLSKYRSLMPTLALLFHLTDWASGKSAGGPVSEDAAVQAALWCDYLEAHARKIYSVLTHPEIKAAETLQRAIKAGKAVDGMHPRDVYRHGWANLNSAPLFYGAAQLLASFNWLRIERSGPPEGGRPTDIIRLHPSLRRAAQ